MSGALRAQQPAAASAGMTARAVRGTAEWERLSTPTRNTKLTVTHCHMQHTHQKHYGDTLTHTQKTGKETHLCFIVYCPMKATL